MNEEYEYLSDDELNKLINDIEQSDMQMAPPDFESNVLMMLSESEKTPAEKVPDKRDGTGSKVEDFETRKRQYSRFRLHVCMAMAAAILLLVITPFFDIGGHITNQKNNSKLAAENMNTNYISQFLDGHLISEAISGTNINMTKEN